MAIDVDTGHALRRPLELQQLVEAVVSAGSADEAFWAECKNRDFNLTTAEGRFKTARAILSFANRMPDTAATVCEGLAYVIVGAEPGRVDGTAVVDGADIDKGLIKYLGGDGPVWSPTYVKHSDKNVLVIVVEAPKWGDRIHALRQEYDKYLRGAIFVRSGSNSRQARDDELRQLEDRLLRGQQSPEIEGLEVGYTISPPEGSDVVADWSRGVVVLDFTPNQVDEWIQRRGRAIRAYHQAVLDIDKPKNLAEMARVTRPLIDDKAIENHLAECREVLLELCRRDLIELGFSLLAMTVTNPGRRVLEHVEMTLEIETPWSAFEQGRPPEGPDGLPKPPAPPRPRSLANTLSSLGSTFEPVKSFGPHYVSPSFYIPDYSINIEESSITLAIGELRPERTATSSDFHLFLNRHPGTDRLAINWTLTSTSTEGIQRGTIQVPMLTPGGITVEPTEGLPKTAGKS